MSNRHCGQKRSPAATSDLSSTSNQHGQTSWLSDGSCQSAWCVAEQGALSGALTQSCVERYEHTKDARFLLPAIPGMQRPAVLKVCLSVLCCAVLCCAVLCCAVLCCAHPEQTTLEDKTQKVVMLYSPACMFNQPCKSLCHLTATNPCIAKTTNNSKGFGFGIPTKACMRVS